MIQLRSLQITFKSYKTSKARVGIPICSRLYDCPVYTVSHIHSDDNSKVSTITYVPTIEL